MSLDGKRIVVTGGMGYVGSHTCKVLRNAGAEVYSIDNRRVEQNEISNVEYITADYADTEKMRMFQTFNIDGFVHCAGTSLVGPSVTDPARYYKNNVGKTLQFLDHIKRWGRKPFIVFSSSAAVYGNPDALPIHERSVVRPVNPYGNTKMMIEYMLRDYSEAYGIKNYIFRYFNAAGADTDGSELGPEPNDTHLIPRIFEAAERNIPFELYGTDYRTDDGTCVRDYIHVTDIALAHRAACIELLDGSDSRTYNLGSDNGYSNKEIIESFREHVGPVEVNELPRREGDPDILIANASKIKSALGWKPQFSDLETIMTSFRDYYEKHNRLHKSSRSR